MTYGSVELLTGRQAQARARRLAANASIFRVVAKPHVMTRLKRLFAKVNTADVGAVWLSDTPENARELLWFTDRYPLEIDPLVRGHLERRAEEHRRREQLVEEVLTGRYHAQPGRELALPLRDYQTQPRALVLASGSLLLADDVGLGKTAQAIALFVDTRTLPALVVTLTHLTTQWKAEIEKFAPHLRVHVVKKGTPYDLTAVGRRSKPHPLQRKLDVAGDFPDVVVMNYAKISGWAETLAPHMRTVIFDECQELRHSGTDKYNGAKHVADAAAFRMGLSATPFYNYGSEIFSVAEVLSPDSLGTREEFLREWCTNVVHRVDQATGTVNVKGLIADPNAFGEHMRASGLMLRRKRKEVGREIPPISIIEHAIDCDLDEIERVASSATELARIILAQGGTGLDKMKAAGELDWKLRHATGIAKAPYVAELVRMLVEGGERVLLYGWHHDVYNIWLERLKDFRPVMYTGQESTHAKEEAKNAFIGGETPILIMSLRSGAGVDGLQKVCRTTVHGELDWSPGVHEQDIGRIARDGQTDPVAAYFPLAREGADPIMWDVCGVKARQIDGVRDPGEPLVVEDKQIDPARMRRLAESFLRQRGEGARVAVSG